MQAPGVGTLPSLLTVLHTSADDTVSDDIRVRFLAEIFLCRLTWHQSEHMLELRCSCTQPGENQVQLEYIAKKLYFFYDYFHVSYLLKITHDTRN